MSSPTNRQSRPTSPPTSSAFDDDLHTDDYNSPPKSRPIDFTSPIPDEEEEGNRGPGNILITPTDRYPRKLQAELNENRNTPPKSDTRHHPSVIINASIAVPSNSPEIKDATKLAERHDLKSAPSNISDSARKGTRAQETVLDMFQPSSKSRLSIRPLRHSESNIGRDSPLADERPGLPIHLDSGTSQHTSKLHPPRLLDSPTKGQQEQHRLATHELSGESSPNKRDKKRSSTGLNFRNPFHKHRLAFPVSPDETKRSREKHRSTSVELDQAVEDQDSTGVQHLSRQLLGMAAETGSGLKARRLSFSLPDDIGLDVVELYTVYAEQSKLLGRYGKSVGKGATANVRLMHKKGSSSGELYAAKEFRGKSSNETAGDYEKKVKSEYSIAKSVHHPNIVETFSLCTHHGRWIQVMEFCDQGDLFSLVSQKYLAKDEHLADRLCLFKQLVHGLNYLHNNGIAHRDVKLENILLTKDSKLKITDFGVSEVFSGLHPGLQSADGKCGKEMGEIRLCAPGICGSPPYIAPEVMAKEDKYDPRPLDVWGAAIVMLCMCANGCLWEKAIPGSSPIYDGLVNGWAKWNSKHSDTPVISESDYPHVTFFDKHINPPALRRLLLTMLNPDPSQRVTMASVANNRWLKVVECCQSDTIDDPIPIPSDTSRAAGATPKVTKIIQHNHQPPHTHAGYKRARPPSSGERG